MLTSEEQRVWLEKAAAIADIARTHANRHDQEFSRPEVGLRLLAQGGFRELVIPREFGGVGAGIEDVVLTQLELGKGDPSLALIYNMHLLAMGSGLGICREQPKNDSRLMAARQLMAELGPRYWFCSPVSEPGASGLASASFVPSLTAQRVKGGYRLKGKKLFATNIDGSSYALVFARREDTEGPLSSTAFIVEVTPENVAKDNIWYTTGMRATGSHGATFDVFVPDNMVLHDTPNFIQSFLVEDGGLTFLIYTAVYQAVAERQLEVAVSVLSTRIPKGSAQPVGYLVAGEVGECATRLAQSRLLLQRAAQAVDQRDPRAALLMLEAKLAVGEAAEYVSSVLTELMGVHGLLMQKSGLSDGEFERLRRDGATARIMPPTSSECKKMVGLVTMGLDPAQAPMLKLAQQP